MPETSDFICPSCQLPLKETRTAHGIFWSCDNCGGRAVTIELLRRTFTPECINPLWLHAMRGEGTRGRPCPECRQPMLAVPLSGEAAVAVDLCKHCHFVWFDRGEVDTLKPRPVPPSEPELPQEARELLAMEKIKRLAEEARGSDFDSTPPDEWWQYIAGFFGMPVEYDAPAQQRQPWITWLLGIAILCVGAATFPRLREVVENYGLIPAQATRLGGATFFTSFFLHGGIIHLLSNLYFLVVSGDNVEDFLGPWRYLFLVALAAFIGDLAHIVADPQSQIPSIGASGGISGIIVFYALEFPRVRIGFLMRSLMWFRWIRFPAWFALTLWILLQFVGAWQQKAGISSVSAFAHLGGAAVGFIAWLLWRNKNDEVRMPNDEGSSNDPMTN